MTEAVDIVLQASFWSACVRIATPLILGTLGALICERAGVLNLGIEGIMTAGAMSGWLAVHLGADLWAGVGVAASVGALFGLLHAVLTVPLALSQHVSGIGVTLLATSLAYFTYRTALPQTGSPPRVTPFAPLADGPAAELPVLGPLLLQQTPLTLMALIAVPVLGWLLWRTPLGLALRAVGENPAAVEAQGLSVTALRTGAVVAGSAVMGVAGSVLTLATFNAFFFGMIGGRGWICIALVVFASWRPGKALLGALLFGAFDAFQIRLQQATGGAVPYQLFLMLPYLLSIMALILVSRGTTAPQALMRPYRKGQR